MRWEWWDWEEARNMQWCRKDSLDLIGRLGSSGACTVSILLVGPIPGRGRARQKERRDEGREREGGKGREGERR